MKYEKNRERSKPSFANINFMGNCNARCFFCLGHETCSKRNLKLFLTHFSKMENLNKFLDLCRENNINRLYFTGLDSEPTLYPYLDKFADYLISQGFQIGLRTNGTANHCFYKHMNEEISVSVHSFDKETNKKIGIPTCDFEQLKKDLHGLNHRYAILVNHYNENEILHTIKLLCSDSEAKYIQLRQVCTDYHYENFEEDILSFERVADYISKHFELVKTFEGCNIYNIYGKEVSIWRPLQIKVNSFNYFIDGTISTNYFIIEGYNKETQKNN